MSDTHILGERPSAPLSNGKGTGKEGKVERRLIFSALNEKDQMVESDDQANPEDNRIPNLLGGQATLRKLLSVKTGRVPGPTSRVVLVGEMHPYRDGL